MNTLREALHEYLAMRRSLGFRLRRVAPRLVDFVTFMEQQHASYITVPLALTWAKQPTDAQLPTWAQHLSFVRSFARYRRATDPRTEVPPEELLPFRPKRARPYLYSDREICALLRAAPRCQRQGLQPDTYYCLLGLLSVSGMRVSEVQNLKLQDLDLNERVLTIRGAKFGKDRLVPLHPSTCRVLARYVERRRRLWAKRPVSSYLFVSSRGNRLDDGDMRRTFHAISRKIGLRGPTDRHGPRLHDLRHRFASMTLLRWYRAGEDPERRLPALSTYLGHVHWSDTYWYLSALPGLMREAVSRLEQHWEERA
ncbi:MAG: tyrosine-type recombinase/integrase [Steroidobacteraceae bacterium]|jgi:integrase/recombinase XerD